MCFSATASFTAAAVLSTAGVFSLKQVSQRSQAMFASIPLLFGVQQCSEGFLWLSLSNEKFTNWQTPATYIFLFFAQMLWTTWIPLSFLMMEHDLKRKQLLQLLSVIGILATCVLGYRMLMQPVFAEVSGHHIKYVVQSPNDLVILNSLLYVAAIVGSPFLSSIPKMRLLAFSILISLIVTKLFYETWLVSVWCFFAASLSVVIIRIVRSFRKPETPNLHYGKSTDWLDNSLKKH